MNAALSPWHTQLTWLSQTQPPSHPSALPQWMVGLHPSEGSTSVEYSALMSVSVVMEGLPNSQPLVPGMLMLPRMSLIFLLHLKWYLKVLQLLMETVDLKVNKINDKQSNTKKND